MSSSVSVRRVATTVAVTGGLVTAMLAVPVVELPRAEETREQRIPLVLSPANATSWGGSTEPGAPDPDAAAGAGDAAAPDGAASDDAVTPSTADPSVADPSVADPGAADQDAASPGDASPGDATPSDAGAAGAVTPSEAADPQAAPAPDLSTGPQVTDDFDVLGVTWDADDADEVEAVQVRLRQDGEWTEWFHVDVSADTPDPGTAEYERAAASGTVATQPILAVDADGFEVRMATEDGRAPADVEAVTIDSPSGEGTDTGVVPLASAAASTLPQPSIVTRAQWGANESRRNCGPSYSSRVTHAVVHHTAGSNSYSRSQAAGVVNGIYAYHTDVLGWCDIGYNFLVDKYGTVYEGRYGGVDRAVRGAHAGGFNSDTFGVAMMGNHSQATVSSATRNGLAQVIAWKFGLHGIDPNGSGTLTSAGGGTARYSAGTPVTLPTILGHRDVGRTACPGTHGGALLTSVRGEVAGQLSRGTFVQALYADMLGRSADSGGAAVWNTRVRDWGKPPAVRSFTGSAEHRAREIDHAYRRVLGRPADSGGLSSHSANVARGRLVLSEMDIRLMVSNEYWFRSGGTPEGFVAAMYQEILDRGVDPVGSRTWPDFVRRHGREATVRRIWFSTEASTNRVEDLYTEYLGRGLDGSGQRSWVPVAQRSGGDLAVRERIITSSEYQRRADDRF